jgi:tRNA (mo5U34)-methyltransferase
MSVSPHDSPRIEGFVRPSYVSPVPRPGAVTDFERIAALLPLDLTGKSVLDIACNDGAYSLEMMRRGARRVVGIDRDELSLQRGRVAAMQSGYADVEFRSLSVYDVASLGERFDVVLLMGVLGRLQHPLLALDTLYDCAVGDLMIVQGHEWSDGEADRASRTGADERSYPLMYHSLQRSASRGNWWTPNRACIEALLRSAGFTIESAPDDQVYFCRR